MHIPICKCKDSLKWWCPNRLIPNKCRINSRQLVVHTLETRAAHASTQGDLLVASKIISAEVALTVETTSIIIMVVATKDRAVPALNSTHRSSRLSSAVTLCNREPALSKSHASSLTENMSWEKSLTPCQLMPTWKLLLFSKIIRDCSKIIKRNPEVEVVIITTLTIILEVVATSKITTIKLTEEETLTREAEAAKIKVDMFPSLTATSHLPITLAVAESRTLRQLNARTLTWAPASMALHAPSPMETRTWERHNPRDLLKHPSLSLKTLPNNLMQHKQPLPQLTISPLWRPASQPPLSLSLALSPTANDDHWLSDWRRRQLEWILL